MELVADSVTLNGIAVTYTYVSGTLTIAPTPDTFDVADGGSATITFQVAKA